MERIKKVYVDSRYKTSNSISNSDFKFELKETLDLPDNTVCYIDDISIPHSWWSVENNNNKLYVETQSNYTIFVVPTGNYTGVSLAIALQTLLQTRFAGQNFQCVYQPSKGSVTITSDISFRILPDTFPDNIMSVSWTDVNGNPVSRPNYDNLQSMNDVLRNTVLHDMATSYESEFIDLMTTHNIYLHSPNLGHFNSLGVRGENTIIIKNPVSSNFGYMILDSVVAPHDKIDCSKQLLKTVQFTLKNVHGNVIDLHGGHVSFSMIFQTIE